MLLLSRDHDFQVFLSPSEALPHCTNPPAFHWPILSAESRYTFELLKRDTGECLCREQVRSPVLCDTLLALGEYQWRVTDDMGDSSEWLPFTISGDEPDYLPPVPAQLFAACEARDQWMLYLDEDIAEVREHAQEDLARMKATAQVALNNSLPAYPDHYRDGRESYKRLAIHQIREWVDRDLMSLCLLYRIEDDQAAGEAAVERLLKLAEWSTDGPATLVRPCQWGDEVGLSLARNVFLAYHWLRPLLAEGERAFVRSLLIRVAEQMVLRLQQDDFAQYPGHSHTSRLPAYLGVAALVLHKEHDRAKCTQWMQQALDLYQGVLPFYGSADGGWAEGAFYSSSYTKWFHPFFLAVERLSGFSFYQHPFYKNYLKYCRDFVVADNDLHPFGDGFWCRPEGKEWPGFFAQNPLRIYAQRFGSVADIEHCRLLEDRIEIYSLHLLDVIPTLDQVRLTHERIEQQTRTEHQDPGDSRHAFYPHAGHGLERFGRVELRYRCSPFGNSSHRHADQGNISLIDNGHSLLCPTGSYGYAFGSQHHREWTRTSRAHNVPLIAGEGQLLDDPVATAQLLSRDQRENAMVVRLDMSAAYAGGIRVIRTLVLLRDAGLVIHDELSAEQPFAVEWNLHSAVACAQQQTTFTLSAGQRDYRLRLNSHPDLTPTLQHGYVQSGGGESNEEHDIIDSDARQDVSHMTWRLAARTRHHVIASCFSQDVSQGGDQSENQAPRIRLGDQTLSIHWADESLMVRRSDVSLVS
ncbi:heparinase II/III family protein [Cobetia sp. QF-1]|uniref:heparinase II/III domain-containing protein n=1 Tax=Cobetia sp. QF-1 TaxID=1969833 RepID=UPI000B53D5BA|nr:heparinase II/III family protein [Cobetia sp. QF-1]